MGPQFLFNMGGVVFQVKLAPKIYGSILNSTVPGSHNEGVTPRTECPDACFLPGCKFRIFSSASFSLVCLLLEGRNGLPLKAVLTISKSAQLPFLRSTCPWEECSFLRNRYNTQYVYQKKSKVYGGILYFGHIYLKCGHDHKHQIFT